eukprot:2459640-Prymnesium_polylepis.4
MALASEYGAGYGAGYGAVIDNVLAFGGSHALIPGSLSGNRIDGGAATRIKKAAPRMMKIEF